MSGIRLNVDSAQARQATKELREEMRRLGTTAEVTEDDIQKLERLLKKGMGADRAEKQVNSLSNALKKLGQGVGGTVGMRSGGGMYGNLRLFGGLAGVGMIGAAVTDIVKTGAQFEQTMREVGGISRTVISGQLSPMFLKMEEVARKMGETTEWTASQAADALKFLSMAGFAAADSIRVLPGMLDLATAGNLELGRAADIATNALTAMRLSVFDMDRVSDTLIRAITTSNTNMEMMAESFKYSAAAAAGLSYTIEELSAYIGLLGNAGIQGSMAGTQLSMAMQEAGKAFEYFGDKAPEDVKLIQTLEYLESKGAAAMEVLDIYGQRAGRAVMSFLGMGSKAVKEYTKVVYDHEQATKQLATTMRATTVGAYKELKSVIESVQIDIFNRRSGDLNDTLRDMSAYIRQNREDFIRFAEALSHVGTAMVGIAQIGGHVGQHTFGAWGNMWKGWGLVSGGALPIRDFASMGSAELREFLKDFGQNPEKAYLKLQRNKLVQAQEERLDSGDYSGISVKRSQELTAVEERLAEIDAAEQKVKTLEDELEAKQKKLAEDAKKAQEEFEKEMERVRKKRQAEDAERERLQKIEDEKTSVQKAAMKTAIPKWQWEGSHEAKREAAYTKTGMQLKQEAIDQEKKNLEEMRQRYAEAYQDRIWYAEQETEERKRLSDDWREGISDALKDIENEHQGTAMQIKDVWAKTTMEMGDTFGDFFTDVVTGDLKSFSDYAISILRSIVNSYMNMLGQNLATGISAGVGGMFRRPYSGVGTYGVNPGSVHWHASGGLITEPLIARGVRSGDTHVIAEKGPEWIVPANKTGVGQPNIKLEVHNNTGVPAEPRTSGPTWDGQQWVVSLWLDAFARNKFGLQEGLRGSFGG